VKTEVTMLKQTENYAYGYLADIKKTMRLLVVVLLGTVLLLQDVNAGYHDSKK